VTLKKVQRPYFLPPLKGPLHAPVIMFLCEISARAGGLSFFVLLPHLSFFSTVIGHGVITIRLTNAKPFQRDSVAIVRNGVIRRVSYNFHGQILWLKLFCTRLVFGILWYGQVCPFPSPYPHPEWRRCAGRLIPHMLCARIDSGLLTAHTMSFRREYFSFSFVSMGSRKIFFSLRELF